MATRQNTGFIRLAKLTPVPDFAGVTVTARFPINLVPGLLAADILEVAVLPAGCKMFKSWLITTGIAAVSTVEVGMMTGTAGDLDAVRTMSASAEIFNDVARNASFQATPTALDIAALAVQSVDRGIGFRLSLDEVAGAGKSGVLFIEYYRP